MLQADNKDIYTKRVKISYSVCRDNFTVKSRQLDKNRKIKIDWEKYNFEIISKLTLIHSISLCSCGLVKNAKTEVQGLASYERERDKTEGKEKERNRIRERKK